MKHKKEVKNKKIKIFLEIIFGIIALLILAVIINSLTRTKIELTSSQKSDLALFFPNDLINNLTVYKGGLISIGASKAIGNNIYLNEKDLNDTSMLIHEATHSYQKGGVGEMISSIYVQFVSYLTHGTRHYAYYYSINDSVENFNSEQEASLVQDFYVYSYNADDGTSEGFENSPRIMYNNGVKTLTSCTYYIPEQNGVSSENADAFLQFSHLTDIPTLISIPPDPDDTVDFHFGICQLIQPIGDATPNNLFNTYWLPYFNELYNPDTRTMTLKVNLTPGDINTFNFYDTVFIKNRLFRVNKIDYKPNELATVEFILIP